MSNASLNAKVAIAMVCDALAPFNFDSIMWVRDSRGDEVVVQCPSPEQRTAVADRLGLGTPEVNRDGTLTYQRGAYADIPVKVYSGPSFDEVTAWALARAAS